MTEYWYRIRINAGPGWRVWMGRRLRNLADRIDGRTTLAIEILSVPPLSRKQQLQCLLEAKRALDAAVSSEVHAESLEAMMKEHCGRLYEGARK